MNESLFSSKFLFVAKCFVSLVIISFFAYKYIDRQNTVTAKRREIPELQKKLKTLEEENTRLQYEIDKLENPVNLMRYSRMKQFQHLHYPRESEVITLQEGGGRGR
ncbi:hypothetical protein [Estrella lausannensis]|uniref:Putative cell division protein ftsL n=1 Tax=Estrella lausannensis TaxID=483423 RepID=A0A0H5DR07_9BACT|nr:hypothetical protein [Estrella lausannensis]CRX39096.1 Putative cell division protein ftsL [Estrella lausannensis]